MIGRAGTPIEQVRWDIVERTGWTLEYIDALSLEDLHEYIQVMDGKAKARGSFFANQPKPKVERIHGRKSR